MEIGAVGSQLRELVASPIPARVLDPGRKWDGGYRRLMSLCYDGNAAAARLALILDPSLDLELRDPLDGESFLDWSCEYGRLDVARVLVEAGAEVDAVNDIGHSALHVASKWGRTAVVRWLLEEAGSKMLDVKDKLGGTHRCRSLAIGAMLTLPRRS